MLIHARSFSEDVVSSPPLGARNASPRPLGAARRPTAYAAYVAARSTLILVYVVGGAFPKEGLRAIPKETEITQPPFGITGPAALGCVRPSPAAKEGLNCSQSILFIAGSLWLGEPANDRSCVLRGRSLGTRVVAHAQIAQIHRFVDSRCSG